MEFESRIFDKLDKIDDAILSISTQNARYEEILTNYTALTASIELRVRRLEEVRERQKGMILAISAIVGVAINLSIAWVKNLFK